MPFSAVGGYARKYLVAPRYERADRRTLTAADGVRLSAAHLPGPVASDISVVLVHGFANWSRSPRVHAFAHLLAAEAEVIALDLRGHGRSGGGCTFGSSEPLDVEAAVRALSPGRRLVTVGASLGAAAVLAHAAGSSEVATVVAVSPPAWWGRSDRAGATRIRQWTSTPAKRAVLSTFLRTRLEAGCPPAPHAVDAVGSIAPARTVVVHDPDDVYFGPEHAVALYEAACEPKELWWRPGEGHGTDLFTAALARSILDAVSPLSR